MATVHQSLYQSAAIFAGGLAFGAGALALSRSSFAPAHKPTKSTKRKLSDASKARSASVSKPQTDTGFINHANVDAAKSSGALQPHVVAATASSLAKADTLPPVDRVKHLDTRMDLGRSSSEELDSQAASNAWLTRLTDAKLTSTAAIDAIAYDHSTAVFSYESDTNGGFGSLSERQAQHAAQNGWIQGRPKVFKMQTRSGAANAIVGYLSSRGSSSSQPAKVVTALTNAAGLAAMAPTLSALNHTDPFDGGKLVLQISAASQTTQPDQLTIASDYASILSAASSLGDGFVVVLSSTRQEAVELAQYAYQTNKNVIHVFDGAFAGRQVGALSLPAKGTLVSTPESFSYTGPAKAKTVLVVPNGSHSQAIRAVLVTLPPALRHNVGILAVRTLRPWSDADLRKAIPQSADSVHVLEQLATGASAGPLYDDVISSLFSEPFLTSPAAAPKVVLPVGLASGATLTAAEIYKLLVTVAENADVAVNVADIVGKPDSVGSPDLLTLSGSSLVTIYDSETSSTTHLASLFARTLSDRGEATKLRAQLLSRYDNFEASGIVRSDVVLTSRPESASDAPIELVGDENSAQILVISDPATTLKGYAPFHTLVHGGTVLFNTPGWDAAELDAKLRAQDKKILAEKHARLVLVDAAAVVDHLSAQAAAAAKTQNGQAKAGADVVPNQVAAAVLLVALIKTQLESSGSTLAGFVQNVLETAPLGVAGVDGLVDATEKAIQLHAFDRDAWAVAEPISEAEANAAPRATQIRYNGFSASIDTAEAALEPQPQRNSWALPAWQTLFSEAYSTASDTLRPDLPEKTWVVQVTENRRLTPVDYDRNVFHMELSTKGTDLKYEVGEALGVHGWNDEHEVADFIGWAGLDGDEIVSVPSVTRPGYHESRTVFQVLQQNLDLFGKPPKRFYEALGKVATNLDEARWLRFISSAEGAFTFKKLSENETLTYVDVMRMFPSARLPLDQLLVEVEPIKPRHYSIASAQVAVEESIHLLIVTVDWKVNSSGSTRFGQCTRYLANLRPGAKVTVSLKPSVMKLPPLDSQPIIMAGLGTGAAPFRAFIQARAHKKAQGIKVGPLVYYFGSRYRSSEYLYGEELEAYTKDGVLQHMGLAFSRDSEKKTYIQHKITQDGDLLTRYLAPELEQLRSLGGQVDLISSASELVGNGDDSKLGYFFVCGPTWPVPDIHEALVSALIQKGLSKSQAEDKMEQLKEQERYVLEVY